MSRELMFNHLRTLGVTKVVLEFSGGGDEGGVDSGTVYYGGPKNYEEKDLPLYKGELPGFDGDIVSELSEPVYDKYHSFAGEFHVYGEVVWDVDLGKVLMEGKESVETWKPIDGEV